MNKQKCLVEIEKAQNNYSAFSPDVASCITTGDFFEETLVNMKDAVDFDLEGAKNLLIKLNLAE